MLDNNITLLLNYALFIGILKQSKYGGRG